MQVFIRARMNLSSSILDLSFITYGPAGVCLGSLLVGGSTTSSMMMSSSVAVLSMASAVWFFSSRGSRLTVELCVATGLNFKLVREEGVLERLLPLDALLSEPTTTRNSWFALKALCKENVDTTLLGQSVISAGNVYMSRMHDGSGRFVMTMARPELRIV